MSHRNYYLYLEAQNVIAVVYDEGYFQFTVIPGTPGIL
jgi:hypothetical protein